MSTIITPSEEQINIVVNDEKISINVESGDVIVNVNEQIVEVSTVNGGYPLPSTVYSVFGRTGNIIAVDGDYDLGELGDVTLVSSTNGDVLTYDGTKWINKAVTGTGTVTSVDMSVPVGLQVSGNPITINGTIALNYAAGYSLPTTAKQTTWDTAYNDSIISASVSGTTTKTLTLNQQDGGTITASWTDIDTNLVTSVNGYVGTVVLTTSDIAEGSRLYYTETRVSNNTDVAANTAARHSAVTIGTANGLSLTSQVLSLALASASTTGALSSTDWVKFNTAYNDSIVSASVSGTTTKTLTLTQQDAGTITASWSDLAASGTVTSVGASVPTGMTISGSPIVNAGTLAFGLDTGYTIPLSTQLVPSGGSEGQLLAKYSATNYDTIWIDNYTEQLRDTVKAAVAINKGQAVYVSDANGTNQIVSLASNASEGTSSKTLGLASQNFAINDIGQIITEGLLSGINTSNSYAGDPVWLGVSGNLIFGLANKPVAPAHLVYIGVVTRAQLNNGEIYVKIQNGFELQELHNVLISSVANNEGLFYETSTSLWKNKSIATVLGYTPISLTSLSGVSPLSYNNTTGAFSIAQATTSANGYLSSTDWNTFNGKQAALNGTGFVKATGTTISYDNSTYYLASNPSAYIALTGLSATAPLSYNNTTGGFTISQAGVSGNGYLSSTDWNTFNNKQAAGDYITALSGEATASGPGSAAVTLSTSAVTGKILTGVNITGGSISATDSILVAFGKVQNQINGVLGGAIYQSVWNASTNSPTLTSGTGTKGYYYIVSVAGSTNLDGITDWKVGDWAIFNGTTWNKVDNSDAVSSVNGYTGAVSLTTSDITEGTRLYYTDVRVSANTDVAANTAARHAAVTLGTANGLSLSTQQLSLGLASTSATGALSSTDWNTFNLKQAALSGTGFVKISGSTISYDNSTYYLASNPNGYISSYTETDTLSSVVSRGASTTATISVGNSAIGTTGINILRGRLCFSDLYEANHSIYNNSLNIDGEGVFDGMKMNVFVGLDIRTGNASGAVPSTIVTVRPSGVVITGTLTATSFVKTSGTSSQFLKADGSVDSSTYYLASNPSGYTTNVGTVTSVSALTLGTTGTDVSSTVANSTTTPVITLNVPTASATNRGALSSADWTTFNNKQSALTFTGPLVNTSGTVSITQSSGSTNGYLSNTDWTTFNSKQSTLTFTGPLVNTSGTVSITQSSDSTNGYLSNTDWTTFNSKQSALNGTGFVKISGTTISYDNSTYLTTSSASSTYLPLSGGTLTGALGGTSASFSTTISSGGTINSGDSITMGGELYYGGITTNKKIRAYSSGAEGSATLNYSFWTGSAWFIRATLDYNGAAMFTSNLTLSANNGTLDVGGEGFIRGNGSAYKTHEFTTGAANVALYQQRNASGTVINRFNAGGDSYIMGGNFGIGTSTPTYKFETLGASVITAAFGRSDYGASNVMLIAMNGYRDVYKTAIGVVRTGDYDVADMIFCLNGSANGTVVSASDEKMRIKSVGSLLLGTTTSVSDVRLQVAPSGGAASWISGTFSGSGGTNKVVIGAYSGVASIGGHSTGLDAWANLSINFDGGNVLIGKLTNATGLLQVNGTVYATGFYESSDIRFKNILETNPNVNVSGIDVIKFTRKDKDIDQVRYGYSAQQVQSILTDVVTGTDFLNVNYLDVHTLKIAALEQEIKDLKAKMN